MPNADSVEDVTSDTACMIPAVVKAPPVPKSQKHRAFVAMTVFSVAIVFVNKFLLGAYPYIFSLSAAQFGFGWLLLSFIAPHAPRPLSAHLVGTAITAVVCITNISQLVAVIPFSYASLNHRHLASATLIGCGLAAAVAHDLTATTFGVLTAAIGAVGSAWVGVLQKRVQAEMRVSALVVARIVDGHTHPVNFFLKRRAFYRVVPVVILRWKHRVQQLRPRTGVRQCAGWAQYSKYKTIARTTSTVTRSGWNIQ